MDCLRLQLCAWLLFSSVLVFAADSKPLVIFFGGCGFDEKDKKTWETAAATQDPSFEYMAVAFPKLPPSIDCSNHQAIARLGQKQIHFALNEIRKYATSVPRRKIALVSHSSGSALTNEVVKLAEFQGLMDQDTITPIVLDGFRPSRASDKAPAEHRARTYCVTTSKIVTKNWDSMNDKSACSGGVLKSAATEHCKVFADYESRIKCAHMSLVTPDSKYGTSNVNLEWLSLVKSSSNSPTIRPVKIGH